MTTTTDDLRSTLGSDAEVETRTVRANGIDIAYEAFGDPADPTILLVMGLGTQMIAWPDELCRGLADAGHHVVRFDNRDMGLSTHHHDVPAPGLAALVARRRLAYRLDDMAADAVGLLDALEVERAHVVGASMGGFISQTVALAHPDRVLSLALVMTSTGSRRVGRPSRQVIRSFLARKEAGTRDEAIELAVETYRTIGSAHLDEGLVRELAARSYDRSYDPGGVQRQLAAILAQPNRTPALRRLSVPTVVLHGLQDPIVHVSGGMALARAIPGARFVGYQGMGHDLPRTMTDEVQAEVLGVVARASTHP